MASTTWPGTDVERGVAGCTALPSAGLTLTHLSREVPVLSGRTAVSDLDQMFRRDRSLASVIIRDDTGGYQVLSREHLLSELSGTFGYGRALHSRSTAAAIAPTGTVVLPGDASLAEAAHLLLARPGLRQQSDVVVIGDDDAPRLVAVAGIFEHLALAFRFIAMHDPLTGLPNRRLLEQIASDAARASHGAQRVAVLYVDLDGFKLVNDTFGHEAGDRVLVEFGDRLRAVVRGVDIVARLGGDEFAIVLADVEVQAAARIAARVVEMASEPFTFEDEPLYLSASVGLIMSDEVSAEDGLTTMDILLRHADRAMLRSKKSGKRRVSRLPAVAAHDPSAREALIRRRLRAALNRGELTLHFQPKLNLRTGETDEVEALVRWTDSELGAVSPAEFIPIAEQSQQIHRIGAFVLDAACRQAAAWQAQGTPRVVAVNISARQLNDDGFIEDVLATLHRHGLAARSLRLEITEESAMSDPDRADGCIRVLREAGIAVDVDDFGTGHSSLAILRRLPLSSVKIDKAFVNSLQDDPATVLLVEGVIAAAHGWGMTVVAEGVERQDQLDTLRRIGCDFAQGFLIARPSAAADLPATHVDPVLPAVGEVA